MKYQGVLMKMPVAYANPVQYYWQIGNDFFEVNRLLGKRLHIRFQGFECLSCHQDKKIFRQGFCFDCFQSMPQAGEWIMKPELSTAHLDIEDRDLDYEKSVQLQPHVVYLALSSEVKVGVTRKSQVPVRWIDQGAVAAIPVVEVPNRYLAGITEVALKDAFADKTNWRKMLQNDVPEEDLLSLRNNLLSKLPEEVKPYFETTPAEVLHIHYPVEKYPQKLSSLNLDKQPEFEGVLMGVKGQYLIFEDQTVFNIRNYEGYMVELTLS